MGHRLNQFVPNHFVQGRKERYGEKPETQELSGNDEKGQAVIQNVKKMRYIGDTSEVDI